MAPDPRLRLQRRRRPPVSWPVYERHRGFRYTGGLRSVTYTPGAQAPYAPELVARALREAAAAFE
nr:MULTISPECIES: hypothetical protein [Streptomyces]